MDSDLAKQMNILAAKQQQVAQNTTQFMGMAFTIFVQELEKNDGTSVEDKARFAFSSVQTFYKVAKNG